MAHIPASDPLLAAVANAQARYGLFTLHHESSAPARADTNPDAQLRVVVAVSGGADSVCLLHVLVQLAGAWGVMLHVAHVDHGLRPQSAAAARFVGGLAADLGLAFHATTLDPVLLRADSSGLEAAARHARYTFLCQVARRIAPAGVQPCLAVAHHANDQAETILLRLLQGSGLRGLASLRPLSSAPIFTPAGEMPVRLVRPLLAVSRDDILAYLARHNLTWLEDESNDDLQYARNRLRHRVLPELVALNPGIVATLGRNAELWADEAARLEAMDDAALAHLLVQPLEETRVVLDLAAWQLLPPPQRRGVLRAAFDHLGADARQLGYSHLDALARGDGAVMKGAGLTSSGPHPLPDGLAWSVIAASPSRAAFLCLHDAKSAPLNLPQPQLDATWRSTHGALSLTIPGEMRAGGWRLVCTPLAASDLPTDWAATGSPWRLFADAAALGQTVLTTPRPGLRLQPLGMDGRHRRLVDCFRSHKIPPSLRLGWPILVDCRDGQVLWACGLQPAESLRITAQTQQVVLLEWLEAAA